MNRYFIILFVLFLAGRGMAESTVAQLSTSATEQICGFTSNYRYTDAARVKEGLGVDLVMGDVSLDHATTLRFFVNRKPSGVPVDNLQVEHERLIHIIGVRDDLSGFFHIHPLKVAPGMWAVSYTFENGGSYKLWSDVKLAGVSYGFAQPVINVSGNMGNPPPSLDFTKQVSVSNFRVSLELPEPLIAGATNQLRFTITDAAGNPANTEYYLGAPMHLVIIKDDLSAYIHAHPDNHIIEPVTRFRQVFKQPGVYKLFAQFRPLKTQLPLDDALLAEFYVKVAASGAQ